MRFKAVLVGALVRPFGKGDKLPWQVFTQTQHESEELGKQVLGGLRVDERAVAYVKVTEITEVLLAEIHTAKEQPADGSVAFAIARHDQPQSGLKQIGA